MVFPPRRRMLNEHLYASIFIAILCDSEEVGTIRNKVPLVETSWNEVYASCNVLKTTYRRWNKLTVNRLEQTEIGLRELQWV